MPYKALYRTYRPQTFEEVAGQKHIVQTLKNALAENKIAHAYLFCGPRGTGKTTLARLFAKALNCEEGFGHQCNHCENCLSITEGNHPDVIEIDAASNRGIDDIRNLIDRVRYAPIRGKYKIYIIDEVHMLTTEAFNALLKTLEEPPANVVFILATTEPFKLMPTILSRCQRYDFTKVSDRELSEKLNEICQKEEVEVEGKALNKIIELADGGVRDALSMLDQALAYSGKKLEEHHVNEIFGLTSKEDKLRLLKAAHQKDIKSLMEINEEFLYKGIDVRRLTTDLLDVLKDLLIYHTVPHSEMFKIITYEEAKNLNLPVSEINAMIDILLSTIMQYRLVASANSLFEIMLLKLASCETQTSESKPSSTSEIKVSEEKNIPFESKTVSNNLFAAEPSAVKRKFSFEEINEIHENGALIQFSEEDLLNIMVQANKQEKQFIQDAWEQMNSIPFDEKILKYITALKSCFPRIVSKESIILESYYNSLVNKINTKENQKGFRRILNYLTGRDYLILCLSHEAYQEKIRHFKELNQVQKLPSPKPIDINAYLED